MQLHFHQEDIEFSFDKESHASWLARCFDQLNIEDPDITYIFCSDEYLLDINRNSLDHDYYTDIITFDNRLKETDPLFADLFISIDRIKANAEELNTSFESELKRVMIHGVLHLWGFNDKTESEKILMREKEDQLITL